MRTRPLAILAVHDEARFISLQLEHLSANGLDIHVIMDRPSAAVREAVEAFRGRGVVEATLFPERTWYDWQGILEEKQRIAREVEHDWIVIGDVDEFRDGDWPLLMTND